MKNIILTGLMGSGKTEVSKLLAKNFPDFQLIETDMLIADNEKMSINEIFFQKGEKYFRGVEKTIIKDVLAKENQIISLGGGSLENDFDFELAKKNSLIFYLKANVEILYERIKNNKDRPLLNCENPKKKLEELLAKREPNYQKSDFIIEVNNLTLKEVAENITGIYRNETENN